MMSMSMQQPSRQSMSIGARLRAFFGAGVGAGMKADPAFAGVTIINDVPQPHSMPRNYKNYAADGYAANDSVYKCVTYIAQNGAAIPPVLYSDATRETEIKSHPLLDRLARPNADQDGVTFRETVLGWYLIAGNAFIYAIRAGGAGKQNGAPDELWSLDPNKVHPLPTPKGIVGYKYDDFTDAQNPIAPALIGHLRSWNPTDPIFGLSPVQVAALMIDQQNAARKWNLALMQNMAKPSGAWVTDAALDKTARDRLEERINEKLTGARNAGKTPVLDAGAKWTPTALPPSELDWMQSLQYNAGQIANLYNIPPQLIGDTSATTYNNMEQAKAASYTEAIFPALDKLYSLLSMWLIPMYPDLANPDGTAKANLYYDKTTVEVVQAAIQSREDAKANRATKLYMAGVITLNQAQDMQGLPALGPKGDVYRIGAVLVPADKLDDYAEQSLTEPAAPPMPVAEPIPTTPPAGGTQETPPEGQQPPAKPAPSAEGGNDGKAPPAKPAATQGGKKERRRLGTKARSDGTVTHLLWEVDGNPCAFCLQNDGAVVEADENGDATEPFPNGCMSPDDSHRFCECVVHQLAVPDDQHDDLLGMTLNAAVAAFAVGLIGSRHDADVAAQQQQGSILPPDDDDEGDETDEDQTGATYTKPKPKPKPKPRKARTEYRRFIAQSLSQAAS